MNRWQMKIDLVSCTGSCCCRRTGQKYVKVEDPAIWIWHEIHANHTKHVLLHATGFFVLRSIDAELESAARACGRFSGGGGPARRKQQSFLCFLFFSREDETKRFFHIMAVVGNLFGLGFS